MDLETQVNEVDVGIAPPGPPVVDLNRATAEELDALPGIGPGLAQRIVAFREERGGFRTPEELATVPGIGLATYARLADRLTVVPLPVALPAGMGRAGEPAGLPLPSPPHEGGMGGEAPILHEGAPPQVEEAVPQGRALPAQGHPPAPEKVLAGAQVEPPAEAPKPPPVAAVAPPSTPAPAPEPARRGGLFWLWSSLLGGLLGMLFTLLVFSGINGSLDLSNSHAVLGLRNQVNGLTAEMDTLRGEISGLRQRLDTLEGLTARVDKAESAVETLHQETVDLDQRAGALESELAKVSEGLGTMQAQTQRVTTFFGGLQALLQDVFGPVPEPTPGPVPQPPGETPLPPQ